MTKISKKKTPEKRVECQNLSSSVNDAAIVANKIMYARIAMSGHNKKTIVSLKGFFYKLIFLHRKN